MSLLQWIAFVRDTRMTDNFVTHDLAVFIFKCTCSKESVERQQDGDCIRSRPVKSYLQQLTGPPGILPRPPAIEEDDPVVHARISEDGWFCACHALLAAKMYRRVPEEDDFAAAHAWRVDASIVFDRKFVRPIARVLSLQHERPDWQKRWLFDPRTMVTVVSTHSADMRAAFLVVVECSDIAGDTWTRRKLQESGTAAVWDMDVTASRAGITLLMRDAGVIPRLIGAGVFEVLFDELHAHSAMADLGPPTSLLFPEFVELCVSIADAMTGDDGGRYNDGSVTLASKVGRVVRYLTGDVVVDVGGRRSPQDGSPQGNDGVDVGVGVVVDHHHDWFPNANAVAANVRDRKHSEVMNRVNEAFGL